MKTQLLHFLDMKRLLINLIIILLVIFSSKCSIPKNEETNTGLVLFISESHCMFCVEQEMINLNVGFTGTYDLPVSIVADFSDPRILKGISNRIKNRFPIIYSTEYEHTKKSTPVYLTRIIQ